MEHLQCESTLYTCSAIQESNCCDHTMHNPSKSGERKNIYLNQSTSKSHVLLKTKVGRNITFS
jgi:hypothetical protein